MKNTETGRMLRAIRRQQERKLKDVSKESGLPVGTIINTEQGRTKCPKFEVVRNLLNVYNVSMEDFMRMTEVNE